MCVYATRVWVPALRGHRKALGPVELEAQAAVSHLPWVLGTQQSLEEQKALVTLSHLPAGVVALKFW